MAANTLPEMGFFDKHADKIEFGAPSDCWLWTAATANKGYGTVRAGGKLRGAHRVAYEAAHGEGSAAGLVVRHRCDTPACVNPVHLEIGTHADNVRDMMERGRHVAPGLKGGANASAKLTEDDVRTIRTAYVRGSRTHGLRALARPLGVDHSLIRKIVRHELWAHVA